MQKKKQNLIIIGSIAFLGACLLSAANVENSDAAGGALIKADRQVIQTAEYQVASSARPSYTVTPAPAKPAHQFTKTHTVKHPPVKVPVVLKPRYIPPLPLPFCPKWDGPVVHG